MSLQSLTTLLAVIHETLLVPPGPNDALSECPSSALVLLATCPAALIDLADSKIHSYKYSDVPTCWRRLYTDASILEALRVTREQTHTVEERNEGGGRHARSSVVSRTPYQHRRKSDDWVHHVVRLLDMAIIMAGAPERQGIIKDLVGELQGYVESHHQDEAADSRPRKRIRMSDDSASFPIAGHELDPSILHAIPQQDCMSLAGFERVLGTARPVVINGAMGHWPALHERPWRNPQYLLRRTFGGRRLIPVELGRSYTDDGWGQSILTFGEFMYSYLLPTPMANTVCEADENPTAEEVPRKGYLAQHDIFLQIPSLRNDISIPDFCYTDPPAPAPGTPLASKATAAEKLEEPMLNAWFGPAGTISPLHTDQYHNILCQVVGRKYVRLYDPMETEKLYPKGTGLDGIDMSNTSEVDVEGDAAELEDRFPRFKEAKYIETILEAGQSLYVPIGWWHYVRSLSISFSVSFWWN